MVVSGLHYAGYNGISPSDINFNRLRIQYSWIKFRGLVQALNQTDMRRKTENHLIEKPAKWNFMCTRKCASIPKTRSFSRDKELSISHHSRSASDASTLNVFESTKREHVISLMILCLRAQHTAQHSAHMIVRWCDKLIYSQHLISVLI